MIRNKERKVPPVHVGLPLFPHLSEYDGSSALRITAEKRKRERESERKRKREGDDDVAFATQLKTAPEFTATALCQL